MNKKELCRMTEVLQDSEVSNIEKKQDGKDDFQRDCERRAGRKDAQMRVLEIRITLLKHLLPSTSPANARYSVSALTEAWRVILNYL